jgi:hypothetical protein
MITVSVVPKNTIVSKMVTIHAAQELYYGLKDIHLSLLLERNIVDITMPDFIETFLSFTRITTEPPHLLLPTFVQGLNFWIEDFSTIHFSIYSRMVEQYISVSNLQVTQHNIEIAHNAIVFFGSRNSDPNLFIEFIQEFKKKRHNIISKRTIQRLYSTAMSNMTNEDVSWFTEQIDSIPNTPIATITFNKNEHAQLLSLL